jgi:trehalose 6-phosphate phosphatase
MIGRDDEIHAGGGQLQGDDREAADGAGGFALFLDFDGTLVEIAPTPDAVQVDAALPGDLVGLRERLGGALAIVTGRPVGTIDAFLGPLGLDVGGLHGGEIRRGGELRGCDPAEHPLLREAVEAFAANLSELEGVLIEDKGCSVAIHWRLAGAEEAHAAESTVERIASGLRPRYRLQRGKSVAELLPANATKGEAIRDFLRRAPYAGRRAVFFGDDLTDEEAFKTVNADGGVSVRVGEGMTAAAHRLATPAAVRAVLQGWAGGAPLDPTVLPPA